MRNLIIGFILFFGSIAFAQESFFYGPMDSVDINYRSGGQRLDGVDQQFIGDINLRPAAGFEQVYEWNLPHFLYQTPAGSTYEINDLKVTPKFSGIPYLGFRYAFGSSLTQDLEVEYHQYYSDYTHLHLQYNRRTSNGFLRNGDYILNDLSLKLYHGKSWYATNLDVYYGAYDYGENNGMQSDSLLNDFNIGFTPVRSEMGRGKVRKFDVKWDNYFRVIGDSIIGSGFKTHHRMNIVNRVFSDIVDPSLFDTLYMDTDGNIRDQYQTSSISSGAGVYFDSPFFKVDASINYQYWKNQNSSIYHDTSEVFLHSYLWASFSDKINLNNEFYFNFIGAIGEIKDHVKLNYQILPNFSLAGHFNFENVYPTPYQRFHKANYYQWEIDDLKMQQKMQIGGSVKYGDTNFVRAEMVWTNINNGRYFINDEWRQDTLSFVSVGALKLDGEIHLGKFSFYPSATVRFNTANFNYQPLFSTLNRISYSTKLFKAQKLGFAVGVDIGYQSKYDVLDYHQSLGIMEIRNNPTASEDYLRLNAFLALSIDQFRFFVKGENISSFRNDESIRIDTNYPIMPFLVRLGITWDFFN